MCHSSLAREMKLIFLLHAKCLVQEWSRGLPRYPQGTDECLGVVGSLSRMSKSGLEALLDVWECSGGPPGCPGMVVRPFQMQGSGREALLDVREWSGVPPGCRECSDTHEYVREWSRRPPGCPG